jgi:hypothetical protein
MVGERNNFIHSNDLIIQSDDKDTNSAVITHGSKTMCLSKTDDESKMINWRGDSSYQHDVNDSPILPFKKSSSNMSRHAQKCFVPMMLEDALKKTYSNSDGGRRKKVISLSKSGYSGYSTEESSEYESPDEDWYYDPRRISKWTWSNDYSSITSENNSESTISEITNYKFCNDKRNVGKFTVTS